MNGESRVLSRGRTAYWSEGIVVIRNPSPAETIAAVDDWEFSTRLGATLEEARALRKELRDLIARLPPE